MGSPLTIPMSKLFEAARMLHLEFTDVCQASCPLCLIETDSPFNELSQNHLTVNTKTCNLDHCNVICSATCSSKNDQTSFTNQ